jgi:hypothetical protein
MLLTILQCLGVWFLISVPSSLLIGALLARRSSQGVVRPALLDTDTAPLTSGYETAQ